MWVDGHTNWFTVVGFRQLASNMCGSLKKGHRVIVVGRLKLKQWERDGRIYHSAEVEAESVGHDLFWGSAKFARNPQEPPRADGAAQRVAVEGVGVVDVQTGEVPSEGYDDVKAGEVLPSPGAEGPAGDEPLAEETDTAGASPSSGTETAPASGTRLVSA